MSNVKGVRLTPAKFAVDLSDGSERGFYVNQDYILQKLHRPHRGINLMYCYYPLDEAWPARAQDAYADKEISFAWDYPYDNYFPFRGGLNGNMDGEPFTCMRDVRRHGQDVTLSYLNHSIISLNTFLCNNPLAIQKTIYLHTLV